MSELQRGLKNTSYLFIGSIISQIIHFFAVIYVARLLGPEQYGVYTTVGAFVGVFFLFTFGGLNKVVLRESSKSTDEIGQVLERSIGIRNVAILLAIILCIITSFFVSDTTQLHLYITIFSADLFLRGITAFLNTIYLATEKMKYISIFNISTSVLSAGFSVFVLSLGYGVLGLLLAQLATHLIVLFINYRLSKRFAEFSFFSRPRLDMEIVKPAAVFSLLAFLTTIATRIDVLMIAAMGTPEDVGIYGIASKIVSRFTTLRNLITTAFFPIFVKRFYRKTISARRMLRYSLMFASAIMAVAVIVAIFSVDIINVLFGDAYKESAPILAVIVFAQAFNWATIPFTNAAQATHNEKSMLYGRLTAAILNIPLNYLFFNWIGLIGVAYSTLVVYASGNTVIIITAYKAMKKQGHIE